MGTGSSAACDVEVAARPGLSLVQGPVRPPSDFSHRFSRTVRALAADDSRALLRALGAGAVLLAVWSAWFVWGGMPVTFASPHCRVELATPPYRIDAPVGGRVKESHLALGKHVRAGDVLVELEAAVEERVLQREQEQLAAYAPQIARLEEELAAEEGALESDAETARATVAEAQARAAEGATEREYASDVAERLSAHEKAFAKLEILRAQADAETRQNSSRALALAARRLQREGQSRASHARAHLGQLRQQLAQLTGDRRAAEAAVRVSEEELARRVLRAPVDGVLGEIVPLQAGAVLPSGSHLATLLPSGALRAVAELPAGTALGRVKPGLNARVLLEGFPWLEYGAVPAQVETVASEADSHGQLRAELRLFPERNPRVPLQHGMAGTVEIELERVAPLHLLLRTTGEQLAEAQP
jgi:multidrug resistance efflux pump